MIAVAICYLFLASCSGEPSYEYSEYNRLLPTPPQELNVPEDASELSSDSVVATLIAIGGDGRRRTSSSVAYVLLSSGEVLFLKIRCYPAFYQRAGKNLNARQDERENAFD